MDDLHELEQALLDARGPTGAEDPSLPPGFTGDPADRRGYLEQARHLIGQLGGADNEVVKRQKRHVIRAMLNGVRKLDGN